MDMKYMMFYIHLILIYSETFNILDDNDELCSTYPPLAVPKKRDHIIWIHDHDILCASET
jgi:hypothetical protein